MCVYDVTECVTSHLWYEAEAEDPAIVFISREQESRRAGSLTFELLQSSVQSLETGSVGVGRGNTGNTLVIKLIV